MLKRGGAPLAPRELEEIAQSLPGVRIAAAISVPASDESVTERIVVVVERSDPELSIDDLTKSVTRGIESGLGFAPDRVVVLEPRAIPRTANGKIRHLELRERLFPAATPGLSTGA